MLKKFLLVAGALFLSISTPGMCDAKFSEFDVSFGILGKSEDGSYYVSESTRRIPLNYKDRDFVFGFIVRGVGLSRFTVETTLILPAPPKVTPGEGSAGPDKMTFSFSQKARSGIVVESIGFDEGDPLGEYTIEVLIDGRRKKVINFIVYDPAEE